MTPNRLVALAIIALFALGYARLLIDAGVRDEVPAETPTLDLVTRAACTAIADPLGEALGTTLESEAVILPDAVVGCLMVSNATSISASELRSRTEGVFRLLQWDRLAGDSPDSVAFSRRPVRCAASLNSGLKLLCRLDDEL